MVNVLERCNGVVSLAQVPDIEAWVLIIIISHDKLRGQFRAPHNTSSLGTNICLLRRVVKHLTPCSRLWLSELEDGARCFEVPDHNLAILASTGQNVRNNPVPAHIGYETAFVIVWLTRLELSRLFKVGGDILNEDFCSTTCQEVLPDRVELEGLHSRIRMDLGCRNTAITHKLLRVILCQQLLQVPESDGSIAHTTSDYSKLINLVDPVDGRELSRTLGHADHTCAQNNTV